MELNNTLVLDEINQDELSKTEEGLKLMKSIQDLNDIQTSLLEIVTDQDEKIDLISSNIETTNLVVEQGTKDLEQAQKYYFSYKPILAGVVIGGIALGPLGILLNVKFGSLFTLAGGAFGGYTGYKIQK